MADWRKAHAAIAARLPSARFAGPDIAGEQDWVEPFVEAAGDNLVLVTRHHYADGPAGSPHISIAKLLGSAPNAQAMLEEMGAIGERHRLPFRIVETNSIFNEGQPGVSDSFASALWGVDFMFQVAVAGGEGINFHTGDAKAYTPIGPRGDGRHEPRPLYYGMLLFKEAARGARMLPARLTSKSTALTSYATRTEGGTLRVCLINMDLQTDARVGIEAGRDFASFSRLRLTAPSAEAKTGVTLGGSAVDASGNWSAETAEILPWRSESVVEVPAASAVMVQLRSR